MSERLGLDADEPADPIREAGHSAMWAREADAEESFALATFFARWEACPHHDLAASDSQTLPLASLLRLANAEDRRRWERIELGYGDPRGAPWLRAAIAARHAGLGADDVLTCAGAQEAVTCLVRALVGPSDHAVVVVPIYQPSERAVTSICAANGVPLDPERDWRLDPDRLAAAIRPNTRLVLANVPNSPTGAAIDRGCLDALIGLCRRHGLWLVLDEIYRQTDLAIDMPGAVPPVVDLYERGVSINGLSKGFGLPGLRVGWAACRDRAVLARALAVKSQLSSCLAGPSEILAHVALKSEARITRWTRAIGQHNLRRLRALVDRHTELFELDRPRNLAFSLLRFRGSESAGRFAQMVAREADLLVLPSSLWHSPLAPVPADRLRFGLGRIGSGAALKRLDAYLCASALR